MATPTLVQWCYYPSAGEAGNAFVVPFQNTTLANNLLVGVFTFPHGSTVSTVKDSNNVTWTAGPSGDSGVNNFITAIYYTPGAAATSTVTVTFSASVADFHPEIGEFYNVATSSPTDGSHGSGTASAPTVQPGSFTPGTSGDLIICSCMDNAESSGLLGAGSPPTAISAGTGANTTFSLLAADRILGGATEYGIQTTAAAINPSISITQGTNDTFQCVAIAFKAASAGTAPSANSYVTHYYSFHVNAASNTVQFPSTGNLLVWTADINNQNAAGNVVTISTTSPSNTVTKYAPSTTAPQAFHSAGATTGLGMTVTVASGNSANSTIISMWDITCISTPTHDVDATASGTQAAAGNDITNAPSLTPTVQPGVAVTVIQLGTGPTSGSIGAGFFYDNIPYTGETDAGTINEGNGRQHKFYTSTSALNFGYHTNNASASNWSAVAVSFSTPSGAVAPLAGWVPSILCPTTINIVSGF